MYLHPVGGQLRRSAPPAAASCAERPELRDLRRGFSDVRRSPDRLVRMGSQFPGVHWPRGSSVTPAGTAFVSVRERQTGARPAECLTGDGFRQCGFAVINGGSFAAVWATRVALEVNAEGRYVAWTGPANAIAASPLTSNPFGCAPRYVAGLCPPHRHLSNTFTQRCDRVPLLDLHSCIEGLELITSRTLLDSPLRKRWQC